MKEFERLINLIGKNNFDKLKNSKVIVFGIGGVGGYAVEALARSGIGHLTLVDYDIVSNSNINRQIIALKQTIGKSKVEVMKERIFSINPNCIVEIFNLKLDNTNIDNFDFTKYDFVIDAIDTVTSKLLIIEKAKQQNTDIISCMGTGNKLDAAKLQIADISKTTYCPLAKIIRKELKKRKITKLLVLFSTEQPKKPINNNNNRKQTPASIVYVPAVAGLLISQFVITKLMEK